MANVAEMKGKETGKKREKKFILMHNRKRKIRTFPWKNTKYQIIIISAGFYNLNEGRYIEYIKLIEEVPFKSLKRYIELSYHY